MVNIENPRTRLSRREAIKKAVIYGTSLALGGFGYKTALTTIDQSPPYSQILNRQDWLYTPDGLPMRKPNSSGVDYWSENREENIPFMTDEAGFVILQRPQEIKDNARGEFARAYFNSLPKDITEGVALRCGDSYLQLMSASLINSRDKWSDLYAISGMGPEQHLLAVQRRFDQGLTENAELIEYLQKHKTAPITLSIHITSHNDLDQVEVISPINDSKSTINPNESQTNGLKISRRELLTWRQCW